jgi:hypothetical protein
LAQTSLVYDCQASQFDLAVAGDQFAQVLDGKSLLHALCAQKLIGFVVADSQMRHNAENRLENDRPSLRAASQFGERVPEFLPGLEDVKGDGQGIKKTPSSRPVSPGTPMVRKTPFRCGPALANLSSRSKGSTPDDERFFTHLYPTNQLRKLGQHSQGSYP